MGVPAGFMNTVFIYDGQSNKFGQLAANYCSLQPVYNSYHSKKHFYLFPGTKLGDLAEFVRYKWWVPTPCIKLNGSHYPNLITEYVRNRNDSISKLSTGISGHFVVTSTYNVLSIEEVKGRFQSGK